MDASYSGTLESAERRKLFELMLQKRGRPVATTHTIQPRRFSSPCAVSYAQQRLWFIAQLGEQAEAAYYQPVAVRLEGVLDGAGLRKALDTIVRRHEVLRTRFATVNGSPMQVISEAARFSLQESDLTAHDASVREAQVRKIAQEEAGMRFNLTTGPLIRGRLLRLSGQEHVLLITMHHIISDGWSWGILISELCALYSAFRQGKANPLPPLPIQYADYAAWQREWLQGEVLERQLAFWKEHLWGAPALLELPTDRPRPIAQSYRGDSVRFAIPGALSSRLRALAKEYGTTLFVIMHTAFAILLSRLSRQEDIVIGVPVANRQRTELEPLIGFFVNTLALRTLVKSDASVAAVLTGVTAVNLAGYANQDVPFEQVVEALNPPRTLSHSTVFQALLLLQNVPRSEVRLPDLTLTPLPASNSTEKFDVSIGLQETEDGIIGTFGYACDLFDRSTVERWASHFVAVLAGMARDTRQQVGTIALLSEAERCQILAGFNSTRVEYAPPKVIHQLFEEQVERTPVEIAVRYEGQQLTYAQLNRKANQLAHFLRKQGVGLDCLVGLCVERGLDSVIGMLGILKAGGAYVPLDPNYPKARLQYMLKDSAPRAVLVQSTTKAALIDAEVAVISLDDDWPLIGQEDEANLDTVAFGLTPSHLGYVIYTSGSTGQPKGVSMPQRALVNLMQWYLRVLPPASRVLQFASLSFDVSFYECFAAWGCGGALVIPAHEIRYSPASLVRFLQTEAVDGAILPVTVLQQIAEREDAAQRLHGLRVVITTGEQLKITAAIRQLFARLPQCVLQNHYGPTETHVVTTFALPGSPDQWPGQPPIGRPVDNTQIYILDAYGQPVPIGVVGEIFIAGAAVASGYLNREVLTKERFVVDPFSEEPDGRMYRTGDLGRWRPDGTIECLGRNDHQVKIRGFRVELGEIEALLIRHPHVNEAVVMAREEAPGQKRLVAYVTGRQQHAPASDELRTYLSAHLPEYMVPSAYVQLEKIPLTPNGKVDRSALIRPAIVEGTTENFEAPVGEVEEALAAIWQELLHVERVGRNDDFFELGGYSMLTAKMIGRLQEVGLLVSLATVFKYPTLKSLAECVETGMDQDLVPNPVVLRAEGAGTPLFLLHEISGDVLPYLPLARALQSGFPVYGLQRLGIWHLESLEQLAAEHVEALRRVQPSGPYRLAGWSFGASLAYEMAYQLIGADETVEFLGMIDARAPTGRSRPDMDDVEVMQEFIRHRFSKRDPAALPELLQINDIAGFLEVAKARKYCPEYLTVEDARRLLKNRRLLPEIANRHSPAPLPLTVHFFDAADVPPPPFHRSWEPLIGNRTNRQVIGGTHMTITQPPWLQPLADAMSAALESVADVKQASQAYSPVFPIHTSRPTDPAVFCIPGAGAGVAYFLTLAQDLGGINVYGLQPRGLIDDLVPHSSVAAAAKDYVEAMRRVQPKGPYRLLGHSFGGWVAFEMARQLREQQQDVAPVMILDAEAPRGQRQHYTRVALLMRLIEVIEQANDCALGLAADELRPLDNGAQMQLLLRRMVSARVLPADSRLDTVHRVLRVFASYLHTVYLPQSPIDATLVLFQPTLPDGAAHTQVQLETAAEWRRLTPSLSVLKVPGNHMTMLRSPHVQHVTKAIKRLWE